MFIYITMPSAGDARTKVTVTIPLITTVLEQLTAVFFQQKNILNLEEKKTLSIIKVFGNPSNVWKQMIHAIVQTLHLHTPRKVEGRRFVYFLYSNMSRPFRLFAHSNSPIPLKDRCLRLQQSQ